MGRKNDLPIILAPNLRKGIMVLPSPKLSGMDLYVVWLNKDIKAGDGFNVTDIEKVDGVIHFANQEMMQMVVNLLSSVLDDWKGEGNEKVN